MSYPPEFDCPITLSIMSDPVMDDMGMTFDRTAMTQWFATNGNKHPIVQGRYLDPHMLHTNYALKSQIERYLASNAAPVTAVTTDTFVMQPLLIGATSFSRSAVNFLNVVVTPPDTGTRQPIVMGIALDNSGSMGENAAETAEGGAFTRMDLCKHTLRTIAGMLGPKDILFLTTFSTTAKVVMKPTLMDDAGKAKLELAITSVKPDANTNIWSALELLNRIASSAEFVGRNVVGALLTDGVSNVDPPRGIVNTYKDLAKPAMFSLSTFGFGYQLDSNMLSELATAGGGTFGFIPDYSMVATVFINWASTVLSTAATSQKVLITYEDGTGAEILTGPIQLGQPRSFVFQPSKPIASISLNGIKAPISAEPVSAQVLAHTDLISALKYCIRAGGSADAFNGLYDKYQTTEALELVRDVMPSADPTEMGQVIMAPRFYSTWGKHYLRAYLSAQVYQQCMNFKDHGLQIYGGTLFHALQKAGDTVFAHLPPLEASGKASNYYGGAALAPAQAQPVNMANAFNNPRGGCWAPGSMVLMADGLSLKPIEDVRKGDVVWTTVGNATVEYALELGTKDAGQSMCKVGHLWLTPWHPVFINNKWQLPSDLSPIVERLQPKVYNLILDQGHVINVSGVLSCTLGHNLKGAVIEHSFFGDKMKIVRDITLVPGFFDGRPVFSNLKHMKLDGVICRWYNDV